MCFAIGACGFVARCALDVSDGAVVLTDIRGTDPQAREGL